MRHPLLPKAYLRAQRRRSSPFAAKSRDRLGPCSRRGPGYRCRDAFASRGRLDGPTADAYNVVQLRSTAPVLASTFAAMSYYWIAFLAPDGTGMIHFRDAGCCGRAEAEVYGMQGLTELPAAWDLGVASTDYIASAQALESN